MLINKESMLKKFESGALLFQPDVRKVIESEPEAVVRCKDCRYSNTSLVSDRIVCVYFDDAIYGMKENDFCSRAERRTDETD